ncbi:hypothetical protein B0H11DRAFT_2258549 [Mycena galericulata]|nr:hypothetical protein B0H11DRAFT_2258549 [Mycena galericulata]
MASASNLQTGETCIDYPFPHDYSEFALSFPWILAIDASFVLKMKDRVDEATAMDDDEEIPELVPLDAVFHCCCTCPKSISVLHALFGTVRSSLPSRDINRSKSLHAHHNQDNALPELGAPVGPSVGQPTAMVVKLGSLLGCLYPSSAHAHSFVFLVPSPMNRKSKRKADIAIPRETDEERKRLLAGGAAIETGASQIIRETTHVRADGSVKQSAGVFNVASSTDPHDAPSTMLRADVRKEEDPEPVYDVLEDEEGGRVLRDSDDPLRQWVEDHREMFLQELLRWEGRGDHRSYSICGRCSVGKAEYRCRDCVGGGELLCSDCIVKRHLQLPLHRIQYWTGSLFERKTLKELGLRIQLGHWHDRDRRCPAPRPASGDDFVIVDSHGVHKVGLDFCGCSSQGSGLETVQLLRAQLFPATTSNPRTAATFTGLHRFHLLSFESKCSAYEYYHSLVRESDNTGLKAVRDRYHEFLRMTREWRHLQMLTRSGRGHDPAGVANTKDGECALLCPACPQPGKNLPEGWETFPEEKQFLFALFLAMDANFRLKRKDVSSEEKDPGLGKGWSFYCDVQKYMEHVRANWNQVQERSRCVAHDAVDKPDRQARGTASSGIGTVDCARHNMKRPNGVGDLQLGERYLNMDYMFFKSVANEELTLSGGEKYLVFLVPKFHLPAHIEECNLRFSFNLTRFVGLMDREAPERGWANTNPPANSTKEMGPGSRRDTLNDHFNDWNYKKILLLGKTMLERTVDAVPMMVATVKGFSELEVSFDAKTLEGWTKLAEEWEVDGSKPNPFESAKKDEHLAKVRHELAEEAAAREMVGTETIGAVRDEMHVNELIAMGLQLEEQQRSIRFDMSATGLHPSEKERAATVERSSKLRCKIVAWMDIQKVFFPVVEGLRKLEDIARAQTAHTQVVPGVKVHEMMLWLPSALKRRPGGAHAEDGCTSDILMCEYRLRVGQANEALHDVRRHLLVRTHLYHLKDRYARGVRANTRSNTKIEEALGVLGARVGQREWEAALKELKPEDVRGMPKTEEGDPMRQQGKKVKQAKSAATEAVETEKVATKAVGSRAGKRRKVERAMSWIWLAQVQGRKEGDPEQMGEALRIEWVKTRARSMRWSEEVDLLEEEMRRVLQFLHWRSEWWEGQVGRRGLEEGAQAEGEDAYARRQAWLQAELGHQLAAQWTKAELATRIQKGREGEVWIPAKGKGKEKEKEKEAGENEEKEAGKNEEAGSEGEELEPVPEVARRAVVRSYDELD